MNTKFCHHCGKQVTVGSKFCSSCGTSLASLTTTPEPVKPVTRPTTFTPMAVGGEDDPEAYLDRMTHLEININALEVEVGQGRNQGETLGSTMANPMAFNAGEARPPINLDSKEVIQQILKEGSALKPESKIHAVAE